ITFRMLNEECNTLEKLGAYLDARLPAEATQPHSIPMVPPLAPSTTAPSTHNVLPVGQPIPSGTLDAIGLISQQISLISQQIALLQNNTPAPIKTEQPTNQQLPQVGDSIELSADELSEIKKPFGATVRIEKHSTALDEKQIQFLTDFI